MAYPKVPDRNSNRTYRENVVAAAASKKLDELYAYDNLNRLTSYDRGTLSGGAALVHQTFGQ